MYNKYDDCQQKFAVTNLIPTGVPSLEYSKRRNFIQVTPLQIGEWQKTNVHSTVIKGRHTYIENNHCSGSWLVHFYTNEKSKLYGSDWFK